MVRQKGFEPPTLGSEDRCSIQLSYWRMLILYFGSLDYLVNDIPSRDGNPDSDVLKKSFDFRKAAK